MVPSIICSKFLYFATKIMGDPIAIKTEGIENHGIVTTTRQRIVCTLSGRFRPSARLRINTINACFIASRMVQPWILGHPRCIGWYCTSPHRSCCIASRRYRKIYGCTSAETNQAPKLVPNRKRTTSQTGARRVDSQSIAPLLTPDPWTTGRVPNNERSATLWSPVLPPRFVSNAVPIIVHRIHGCTSQPTSRTPQVFFGRLCLGGLVCDRIAMPKDEVQHKRGRLSERGFKKRKGRRLCSIHSARHTISFHPW